MTRSLACLIVFFAAALAVAHAHPARPLYEPARPAAPPPPSLSVNLTNTAWNGKYQAAIRIFIFEADGTLSYRTNIAKKGGGVTIKNRGSWKLEGKNLFFDYFTVPGRTLMEFRGVVTDENSIVGEATYPLTNNKVQQTLKRSAQ